MAVSPARVGPRSWGKVALALARAGCGCVWQLHPGLPTLVWLLVPQMSGSGWQLLSAPAA